MSTPPERAPEPPESPPATPADDDDDVILLQDLTPRTEVKGGRTSRVFGEDGDPDGQPVSP